MKTLLSLILVVLIGHFLTQAAFDYQSISVQCEQLYADHPSHFDIEDHPCREDNPFTHFLKMQETSK